MLFIYYDLFVTGWIQSKLLMLRTETRDSKKNANRYSGDTLRFGFSVKKTPIGINYLYVMTCPPKPYFEP